MTSRRTLTTAQALADRGLMAAESVREAQAVGRRYAIALTEELAGQIMPGDLSDPLALQFIPDPRELITLPSEDADPIGDHAFTPVKGVVHRYPDRVLLKVVHVCPVYCRFCFRREMVGPSGDGTMSEAELSAAVAYIASRPEIFEVILTGGDPLMLSARRMSALLDQLGTIEHVRTVRIHSRVPVADPKRITPALVNAFENCRKAVYVAIHANHEREFTKEAVVAIRRLRMAGCVLISQSVLLRGVNDDSATLAALMRRFVSLGIKPYYLHHPDLAPGTSHFRLKIKEGLALYRSLRGVVSGLCQPTYVLDIPGGHGKIPLDESVLRESDQGLEVRDYRGVWHLYPEQ